MRWNAINNSLNYVKDGEVPTEDICQSVREWLAGQSYEFQYEFGMDILRKLGAL